MKNTELLTELKGLGIILVVFGHSLLVDSIPHRFIYLFHLALFYFASGYFFKEKYIYDVKLYFWKRIKSLYLPFIKYGLLFLALHNVFFYLEIYQDHYGIHDFISNAVKTVGFSRFEQLLGTFWFLKSLFIVNISFALLVLVGIRLFKKKYIYIILLILFSAMGIVASYKTFPLSRTFAELIMLPIAALGYFWKQSNREFKFNIWLLLISLVVLLLCINVKIEISSHQLYTNPIVFYLVSVCGIYFSLSVCYLLKARFIHNALTGIGHNTVIIFVWHLLLFRVVSYVIIQLYGLSNYMLASHPIIKKDNYIWCFIYAIAGVAVPMLCKRSLSKMKAKRINVNS